MKLRLLAAALALAGFVDLSPRASAELLTLQLVSNDPVPMGLQLGSQPGSVNPGPYHWSKVVTDPPNTNFPPPIATFCIDLADTANVGQQYTFGVTALKDAPTIGTDAKANLIKSLYGYGYNTAWADPGFTSSAASRAFQLALWELVYETNPTLDVTSGFFSSGSAAAADANALLKKVAQNPSAGLTAYNNASYELLALVAPAPDALKPTPGQDQIIATAKPIPAPPAVLLAGVGLLALAGRARLTRRPTATV